MAGAVQRLNATDPGERPHQDPSIHVLNPRRRTPVSLIIDDSTCLVNLAHYAIPAFAEVFPDRYPQDWRSMPREIPDSFVREFGEWCAEIGVRGKYSVVPYPACVGWIDRELPGWTRQELDKSLNLVRDLLLPNWDIHPEMISHTWAIETSNGRPLQERSGRSMENWGWTDGRSTSEIAEYLAYALRLLQNVGLPCEGVTTPGGFGNQALPELAQAVLESCRDVFKAEAPHYFRHLFTDERSVAPRVEYAHDLTGVDPQCVVSIIGCTGDWFGGWDGLERGSPDRFISPNSASGRLVEVLSRGEPAVMVCHWPGLYCNGDRHGFRLFKEVVRRLHALYDNLVWMKLSEIARYWAARELTEIWVSDGQVALRAPYSAPDFTLEFASRFGSFRLLTSGSEVELTEVKTPDRLTSGSFVRLQGKTIVCLDLPRGESTLTGGLT